MNKTILWRRKVPSAEEQHRTAPELPRASGDGAEGEQRVRRLDGLQTSGYGWKIPVSTPQKQTGLVSSEKWRPKTCGPR